MQASSAPRYALAIYLAGLLMVGGYFSVATIQGDFGLFRRVQIEAEITSLTAIRDDLQSQITVMENKTHRLSDDYLDLDLLDQQAREVLGLVRNDEIIIDW